MTAPLSILIVDDNPADIDAIATHLPRALPRPVTILRAGNAAEAADRLAQDIIDLALIDWKLGLENGVDLIATLGGREANMPLILLSGIEDDAIIQRAIDAGAMDYLPKENINPQILERTIRYALHTHHLETELRRTDDAKSEFIGYLNHEIRTPLSGILGAAALIQNDVKDGPIRSYADVIRTQAQALNTILDEALTLERLEARNTQHQFGSPPDAHIATDTPPADALAMLTGLKVLVVDDVALNRLIVEKTLAPMGTVVEAAENGQQALDMAHTRAYDRILMDIRMPDLDGMEVSRRIRGGEGRNARTPIIAFTANGPGTAQETFWSAGMNALLNKPFTPEELITCLVSTSAS